CGAHRGAHEPARHSDPQAFRSETLRRAHAAGAQLAGQEASAVSDDAGLAERCGITVRVIEGEPRAMKITTPHDLALAELFATEERRRCHRPESAWPCTHASPT